MTLVLNGTTGITNLPSINSGQIGGRRNIVYNGEMKVAQRSTSVAGLGAASGYYTLDRWWMQPSGSAGRFTMAQVADGPAGIANCLKLSTTTADTSIATGEFVLLRQRFEGQDLQQLKKGTASAEQVTVSFWVKGNAAALYVCELDDQDNSRSIQQSFAVTTAWNRIELTFAADTAGALDDDNASSLMLGFWLHAGSDYTSGTFTSNTWAGNVAANRYAVADRTSIFDSTDRTFFITGVQMEIGSTATDFESRSYGEELALCQRYAIDIAGKSLYGPCGTGFSNSTTIAFIFIPLQFSMRATPSLDSSTSAASLFQLEKAGSLINLTAIALAGSATASSKGVYLQCSVASGLTANDFRVLRNNNSATSKIILSAEL